VQDGHSKTRSINEAMVGAAASWPRDGLEWGAHEAAFPLYGPTARGEEVWVQFPGKETRRPEGYRRPWDFRPVTRRGGTADARLSFAGFWKELERAYHAAGRPTDAMKDLAACFYGMATCRDHVPHAHWTRPRSDAFPERPPTSIDDIVPFRYEATGIDVDWGPLYRLPSGAIPSSADALGNIAGWSIPAMVWTLEVIAWQEECKYEWERRHLEKFRGRPDVGRENMCLTLVHAIGRIIGLARMSDALWHQDEARGGRRTSRPTEAELRTILP
jgi:hypothetical protein